MPNLENLLFIQGGACFFCRRQLSKTEASIEHLVARSHGGSDSVDNLVVCCRKLNALLGDMSVKEKLEVVLSQISGFRCPAEIAARVEVPMILERGTAIYVAVENLKNRGEYRPKTLTKLENTIKVALMAKQIDGSAAKRVIAELQSYKWITLNGDEVAYALP